MDKIRPATPLPWETSTGFSNDGAKPIMSGPRMDRTRVAMVDHQTEHKRGQAWNTPCAIRDANAAYIVHAANNYGRLVEALKDVTAARGESTSEIMTNHSDAVKRAKVVLRELGESA